jgi:protein-L-isoaspartate O-methyltransferase
MAKMIITHGVVDVNSWLSFKSERAEAISAMGASQVVDYVAQDGSNAAAIAADVDDVASVMAAVGSPPPELMDAMQRHGVIPPMTIYVEG